MAEVLSPAAYALLEAIAKSESAGDWNVIYGGSKFDSYADHPRQYVTIKSGPNKGDVSSAAGKYQILASTYDRVAPQLGITDFSPESQLRIAWHLAEEAYPGNLAADLKSGDAKTIASVGKALRKVWTSLPGGIEQGQTSNRFVKNFDTALSTRAGMRVPGMLGDDPVRIRESIQDRNAATQGYGEIAPNPGNGRPAYFNETGAPPIPATRSSAAPQPATMSPALQAARQRLSAAREVRSNAAANGDASPAAMAVTPRLTSANGEVTGINDTRPSLDWGQFKSSVSAGGVGSLLDGSMSPGALNPAKPPVAGLRLPTSPVQTTVAGRPDAPIGSLPAAADTPPIPRPRPSLPSDAAPTPAADQPQAKFATTKDGKQVEINKPYTIGENVYVGKVGPDGVGYLEKVPKSIFGEAGKGTVVGGMVKSGMADAIGSAVDDISKQTAAAAPVLVDSVKEAAGGLADSVGGFFGGLFGGDKQAGSTSSGNTLSAPGAGLTPAQRAAISNVSLSAGVKPLAPPPAANTLKPTVTTTTITNPAYTEWVKKYGDGSQVQTAATGGMITKDQLAAIQNVNGAVQAPIKKPAIPPAPPKTITVKKPANTLAAPSQAAPAAPKVQTAQTLSGRTVNVGQTYQSGGYLYTANPNGSFIKVGKVGSPSSNVLTALSTSQPSSAQAYAAANAGPGSVAAWDRIAGGNQSSGGGPASGGEYASGGR